jgi:hypothetical protein
MRIVPLLPDSCTPESWLVFQAVELAWTGQSHPGWTRPGSPQVHALHLPRMPWGPALGETALAALRAHPDVDFLVLRAAAPGNRAGLSAFMAVLEGLLEVTQGSGVKLALRPEPAATSELVRHLREARGAAVGFCWDAGVAPEHLEAIADRLFCAVGAPDDDFRPIQRLGYRWNLAIPATEPGAHRELAARLALDYPPVLFPADLGHDGPEEHP